jgi:hypothetical protein
LKRNADDILAVTGRMRGPAAATTPTTRLVPFLKVNDREKMHELMAEMQDKKY